MRFPPIALSILSVVFVAISFSCKQKLNTQNDYNPNKDTIRPVITTIVPSDLQDFNYGQDIHVIGNASDLESKNPISVKTGRLSSLSLIIHIIDPIADTVIGNPIMNKSPNVSGKDRYTFSEKTNILFGSGITYCRLKAILTDAAGRKDSNIINFVVK